ncbi:MAG: hypothetical protein K2M82_03645 [Lachnospiraceae bacterium]|nr:hypothetical protein [Lachnospiraceae bacterium]
MEYLGYFGFLAFIFMMVYASYPARVRRLEKKVQKLKRENKERDKMSKLLQEFVGMDCLITFENTLGQKAKILCVDDEWVKIGIARKNKTDVIKLVRIENISEVQVEE